MKRYLAPILLCAAVVATAAAVVGYLKLCPPPGFCRFWTRDELKQWTHDNQALIAAVGVVAGTVIGAATLAVALFPLLTRWRRRSRPRDAERLELEHNYLRQLIAEWESEAKRDPLLPDEAEILELKAELVEPTYRLFEASGPRRGAADEGRLTRDLVATLLKSERPVVVLGEPGAGKSVSLRKVMLELAHEGLSQDTPRLPVHLRLGRFTRPLSDGAAGRQHGPPPDGDDAIAFARASLRGLGGHALRIEQDFQRYLDQGRVVFLLDALDEMRRDDYDARSRAVGRLESYAPNKLLLACRKLDFREDLHFLRAHIQPFDRDQIRRFLHRALGKSDDRAFREIMSPANPLRDMAHNPFFLKLLSRFYKEYGHPPASRAELLGVYESQVFKRAQNRPTFPAGLGPDSLRVVLARLAYVITTGGWGVTIPSAEFKARFLPDAPGEGERRLQAYAGAVDEALDLAIKERLLHDEPEQSPAGGDGTRPPGKTLSFHHHRLQEYYTAVYLEEFGALPDWEQCIDDIWWQETLVMLFGITKHPAERLSALLGHIPPRPLLCPELGGAVGLLLFELPSVGYVKYSKRRRWSSAPSESEGVGAADAANFYGLRDLRGGAGGEAEMLAALRERGVVPHEPPPTENDVEALLELSPEPDDNVYGEGVRLWLEGRNAVLLDRLELGVECYRNALGKLRDSEEAGEARARLVAALTAFAKDGNMWETVRAIQIAARVPGVDLYAVVEPALIRKDAWCRSEALAAIARYPLEGGAHRRHTGFLIFLQFMKGDLFYPEPKTFLQSVSEIPRLMRFAPGYLLLSAVSYLTVALPALLLAGYLALRWLDLVAPPDAGPLAWLFSSPWAPAFASAVVPAIYYAKMRWNVPILRATLFLLSLCIVLTLLGQPSQEEQSAAPMSLDFIERVQEGARRMVENGPAIFTTHLVAAGMIVAPYAVECLCLSLLAAASCLTLWSRRILRAPWMYVNKLGVFSTYFDLAQLGLLTVVGLFFIVSLVMWLLSHLFARWVISIYIFFSLLAGAVLTLVVVDLVRSRRTWRRPRPAAAAREFFADGEQWRSSFRRWAKWLGVGLSAAALLAAALWALYRLYAALSPSGYVWFGLLPLSLSLFLLLLALLRWPGPLQEWLAVRELARARLSPESRFVRYRMMLSGARSGIARRLIYREMAKTYKQIRRERRRGKN